jgi:hypothetical protein
VAEYAVARVYHRGPLRGSWLQVSPPQPPSLPVLRAALAAGVRVAVGEPVRTAAVRRKQSMGTANYPGPLIAMCEPGCGQGRRHRRLSFQADNGVTVGYEFHSLGA